MIIPKPVILLIAMLLFITSSHAQSRTGSAPASTQQQLTVHVTLPTVVGVLSDYARALLSRDQDQLKTLSSKRKSRTSNPVVEFTVDLPKGWGSKKQALKDEKK